MQVNPLAAAAGGSTTAAGANTLADTFDTFLTLLTTQLQHQDPLDPLDSGEFTQQLVMFTNAEQTVNTNKKLDTLVGLIQGTQTSGAVNYIGKTVVAEGSQTALTNGSATWNYNITGSPVKTTLTVTNESGTVVRTETGSTSQGDNVFVWDGKDSQGVPLPDGVYELTVTPTDANGSPLAATTSVEGKVTGLETLDDGIVLSVSGVKIPLDKVLAVKETPAPVEPPPGGQSA